MALARFYRNLNPVVTGFSSAKSEPGGRSLHVQMMAEPSQQKKRFLHYLAARDLGSSWVDYRAGLSSISVALPARGS